MVPKKIHLSFVHALIGKSLQSSINGQQQALAHFPPIRSSRRSQTPSNFSHPLPIRGDDVGLNSWIYGGSSALSIRFCSSYSSPEQQVIDSNPNYVLLPDTTKLIEVIRENWGEYQPMETALESTAITLSNDIVKQVLHLLRHEEKVAFRFFIWASYQDGYIHQTESYNDMIDVLSSTKYKAKQFAIVCDMLDYMKRKRSDSVPVDRLLEILRRYAEKHVNLQKLIKKKKKQKTKANIQIELFAFNLLLDSLCKCGLVREADALLEKLQRKITPNARTYNILFFGCCRIRKPSKAMAVLEEMLQMGHRPENFTYNAAIAAFCSCGMVSEACKLFEFMRTMGSTISAPTAKTYCIMIVELAKHGMMDECFGVIDEMRKSGCLPDVSTYVQLIEGMCLAGKIDEAYKFLDEMGDKGYPPDIVTYNCFLKVLCNLKKVDQALKLFERMTEWGCLPSIQSYNMLIKMFFDVGAPERANKMWREMDRNGCLKDVNTYCLMIEGLFKHDEIKGASILLNEIIERNFRLSYKVFDTFLRRLSELGDLQTINKLSDHMRKFNNLAMAKRFAMSQRRKSLGLKGK